MCRRKIERKGSGDSEGGFAAAGMRLEPGPDYHTYIYWPEKIFARKKGILPRETEQIVSRGKTISVKISDIFGNVTYERIETGK